MTSARSLGMPRLGRSVNGVMLGSWPHAWQPPRPPAVFRLARALGTAAHRIAAVSTVPDGFLGHTTAMSARSQISAWMQRRPARTPHLVTKELDANWPGTQQMGRPANSAPPVWRDRELTEAPTISLDDRPPLGAAGIFWDIENVRLPYPKTEARAELFCERLRDCAYTVAYYHQVWQQGTHSGFTTRQRHRLSELIHMHPPIMSRPCVVEPVVIVDSGGYENALYNSRRGCAVCPDPWLWLFKHKDAADIQLIVEIFLWMERVKPPAVLVLVSSDGDFHQVLNIALTRGYTVVVVHNSALSEKLQVLPVVHVLSDVLRGRVTAKPRVSRDHISFFSNPIVGADNEFNIRFRHAFAEYLRS